MRIEKKKKEKQKKKKSFENSFMQFPAGAAGSWSILFNKHQLPQKYTRAEDEKVCPGLSTLWLNQ